jgi:hypothetical protein
VPGGRCYDHNCLSYDLELQCQRCKKITAQLIAWRVFKIKIIFADVICNALAYYVCTTLALLLSIEKIGSRFHFFLLGSKAVASPRSTRRTPTKLVERPTSQFYDRRGSLLSHKKPRSSHSRWRDAPVFPGANPTTAIYNASVVKIYNATNSLARFLIKKYFSQI